MSIHSVSQDCVHRSCRTARAAFGCAQRNSAESFGRCVHESRARGNWYHQFGMCLIQRSMTTGPPYLTVAEAKDERHHQPLQAVHRQGQIVVGLGEEAIPLGARMKTKEIQ